MATPDLSALPTEDLKALSENRLGDISEPTLHYLAGTKMPTPSIKPNTGLAGPVGSAVEAGLGPLDTFGSAISHAASGTLDPMVGLGARVYALLKGEDTEKAAAAAHQWLAQQGTYHAQTPTGKAVEGAANTGMQAVTAPFNAAAQQLPQSVQNNGGLINDIAGTAATLVPGIAAMREAAAMPKANPVGVAKTGSEIGAEAGYKGVHSRQDLSLPGAQAVTDKLIADDAGVPAGQVLSVPAVQNARAIGPARVYDAAHAALPPQLAADQGLQGAIQGIGDTTSQLPRSPDVDALKQSMLAQPNMTRDELFANIQQARERAATNMAAEDPDKQAVGHAYNQLANAYEDFAGRQLAANPNAGVTLEQFQNARTQFAKNYAAEAALKGGEHIDPAVYARIMAKDPNLLSGNSRIVGQVTAALPPAPPFGTERGLVHGTGQVAGAVLGGVAGHLMGGGLPAELAGAAGGSVLAPRIARAVHNLFATGDLGAAGSTATNPALSYLFHGNEPEAGWNRSEPPPAPPEPQRLLPAPATVNAGGGATTDTLLRDLGLTPDVQRAGAAHPGAPAPGNFTPDNPQGMQVLDPHALTQNWAGTHPDGSPNFGIVPMRMTSPDMSDFADVLSGHPTPTTGTGGPEGTVDDIIKSSLFKQESDAQQPPRARASTLGDQLSPPRTPPPTAPPKATPVDLNTVNGLTIARKLFQQQAGGPPGSLTQIASALLNHLPDDGATSSMYREVLQRVIDKNPSATFVSATQDHPKGWLGDYNLGTRQARVYPAAMQDNATMMHVFTHEAVHAATVHAIRTDANFMQQTKGLMRYVQQVAPSQSKQYGFTNPEEFVAEAESNPRFRQVLQNAKIPDPIGNGTQTAFDAYKKLLGNMLGLSGATIMSPLFEKLLSRDGDDSDSGS